MLNMYRNKNYTKRDYECTNVVACLADKAPNDNYVATTHEELNGMLKSPLIELWTEGGATYYGYL